MLELDYKESWEPKNWCFWRTVVLEKTLEIPLDCKEIQPVHSIGDQSWVFIRRTDVEAETPILWPIHWSIIGSIIWSNSLINSNELITRKDPDAGKDRGLEEKRMTEGEMVGWHHWLDGCEFEQAPGVGDGQGSLMCCNPWGHKELDRTEQLNWLNWIP